ncbi:DUF2778 domain-containing protein [Denitromonas sp. IR12]|uniref:DUF2778 domain-containing protein n=1 Tax=Denitromonas iodatirespirans TaxID=2795389 RepID=A0A944H854_DENI1|nr:DUF2778 domain-containing protein [Denitromonas iodatirespirans]
MSGAGLCGLLRRGDHANRREFACHSGVGPIPPGTYFILDRQSGGLLGAFRDLFSDRKMWFALYANDGRIDDETYCDAVKRGQFRLHPKGPLGISEGCITVDSASGFQHLQALIRGSVPVPVPGTLLKAYGKVVVS